MNQMQINTDQNNHSAKHCVAAVLAGVTTIAASVVTDVGEADPFTWSMNVANMSR